MTAPDRDDTRAQAGDVGLSEEEREALWRAAMKSIGCDGYGSHGLIANDLHATVARIKADAYAAGQRDATPTLLDLLTDEQERRCCYGTREGDGRTCDCKFGGSALGFGGERTGCAEMRAAIWTLRAEVGTTEEHKCGCNVNVGHDPNCAQYEVGTPEKGDLCGCYRTSPFGPYTRAECPVHGTAEEAGS